MVLNEKTRSEVDINNQWDLTTIYKSIDDWEKDCKLVKQLLTEYPKYETTMLDSANNLLTYINDDIKVSRLLDKIYQYAHLKSDEDKGNSTFQELSEKATNLWNEYGKVSSFFIPKLLSYDISIIEDFIKQEPKLKEFQYQLERLYRYQAHTLSKEEEKIIATLSKSFDTPHQIAAYLTDSDMILGNIEDENGNTIQLTQSNYSNFIHSSNQLIRSKAFFLMHESFGNYKNTIAKTLSSQIENNVLLSNLKKYDNSLQGSLYDDEIDPSVYHNLIETVNKNMPVLYQYYDLKKRVLGLDELHLYDIYVDLQQEYSKEYSFEEGKNLVYKALGVLGEKYTNDLKKAFDEKWIDIYSNKGKRTGAYSSGAYDTNPFILLNYQNKIGDVSTLAHELGHSMHSYYSIQNNSYQYADYRIFVAEVASTVNELLLWKYMLKNSTDKEEKLYILNQLLELFKSTIYRQTMFAEFELWMYEQTEIGNVLTNKVLSDKYYELVKKYFGNNVYIDDAIRYEWMRIPHFYYHFYVYKYATGLSSACHIVTRILNNEDNALEDYLKFLSLGGSMSPLDELKVAGVDMTNPQVIESAIAMFKDTIDEFDELYS